MSERRAIVMISIGDRAWSTKSSATFEHYCRQIGADMILVRDFPTQEDFPFPDMPDSPGRKNKRAYACKAYFAWSHLALHGYDRVAVVDDTCCVRRGTPDIFELVPQGSCGFTGTSGAHADSSFGVIHDFLEKRGFPSIEINSKHYMNSGVMVYDKAFKDALHPDKICEAADLLYAKYPNQTLTYYLLKRGEVPMYRMPKSFNSIPAMSLGKDGRGAITDISAYVDEKIYIYHVTGAFKNRGLIVEQLGDIMLADWKASSPSTGGEREVTAGPTIPPATEVAADAALTAVAAVTAVDDLSEVISAAYNTDVPSFSYINSGLRRIAVDPYDRRARAQLLRHGRHYTSKIQGIVLSLRAHLETDLFVDVGVNYGECLFSAPLHSQETIVGYEANPALIQYIEKSRQYNDDLAKIEIVGKGVSNSVGTTTFYVDTEWSGQSTAAKRSEKRAAKMKEITIETTTLDAESASWGPWSRALVKVDVEGLEPEVLAGGVKLNSTKRDLLYLIEFDTSHMAGEGRQSPEDFYDHIADIFDIFLVRSNGLHLINNYAGLEKLARSSGRIHCDLLLLKVGAECRALFDLHFKGKSIAAVTAPFL